MTTEHPRIDIHADGDWHIGEGHGGFYRLIGPSKSTLEAARADLVAIEARGKEAQPDEAWLRVRVIDRHMSEVHVAFCPTTTEQETTDWVHERDVDQRSEVAQADHAALALYIVDFLRHRNRASLRDALGSSEDVTRLAEELGEILKHGGHPPHWVARCASEPSQAESLVKVGGLPFDNRRTGEDQSPRLHCLACSVELEVGRSSYCGKPECLELGRRLRLGARSEVQQPRSGEASSIEAYVELMLLGDTDTRVSDRCRKTLAAFLRTAITRSDEVDSRIKALREANRKLGREMNEQAANQSRRWNRLTKNYQIARDESTMWRRRALAADAMPDLTFDDVLAVCARKMIAYEEASRPAKAGAIEALLDELHEERRRKRRERGPNADDAREHLAVGRERDGSGDQSGSVVAGAADGAVPDVDRPAPTTHVAGPNACEACSKGWAHDLRKCPNVTAAFPVRTCKTCGAKTVSTSTIDMCLKCKDEDGLRPKHFLTRDEPEASPSSRVGDEIVAWLHGLEVCVRNVVSGRAPSTGEERETMRRRSGIYEGVADDIKRKWPSLFTRKTGDGA